MLNPFYGQILFMRLHPHAVMDHHTTDMHGYTEERSDPVDTAVHPHHCTMHTVGGWRHRETDRKGGVAQLKQLRN